MNTEKENIKNPVLSMKNLSIAYNKTNYAVKNVTVDIKKKCGYCYYGALGMWEKYTVKGNKPDA